MYIYFWLFIGCSIKKHNSYKIGWVTMRSIELVLLSFNNNYRTHNHVHIYKKEKQLFNKYIRRLVNSVYLVKSGTLCVPFPRICIYIFLLCEWIWWKCGMNGRILPSPVYYECVIRIYTTQYTSHMKNDVIYFFLLIQKHTSLFF